MNKNQINGTAKDITGKAQEQVGKLTGDKDQQAEGLAKQIEGKAEKAFGDVKAVIHNATK